MANEKAPQAADKLPYEFEIPPHLWRMLRVDPNTPSNAKFYATLLRDGDIVVRGYSGFNVPRGNPFALAFYAYLKEQQGLPPELEQIQTHPRIQQIIDNARQELESNRRIERYGSSGSSGAYKGGGH